MNTKQAWRKLLPDRKKAEAQRELNEALDAQQSGEFDGIVIGAKQSLSDVPKNYRGAVLEVNDHGNVTLYVKSARKFTEIAQKPCIRPAAERRCPMTTAKVEYFAPWQVVHSGFGDAMVETAPIPTKIKTGTFRATICKRIDWDKGRLIAAAPELLEACKMTLAYISDHFGMSPEGQRQRNEARDMLRAAIAKAERGQE